MKKKIAIVGYGGQGAWHAAAIKKGSIFEVAGVFDILEKRNNAARAADLYVYHSFEAILADSDVDIVVCATPNDSHKEIVIEALRYGKNVICEKPAALSSEDFSDMVKCAEEYGKLFTVHQNRRWDLDFLAIKSLCDSQEIGEIINIESRIHGSRGIPSDWRCHKEHGGGMVLDWGVHLIDQILQLIPDKICSVYCTLNHITTDEVDDGFTLNLKFESGKTATVQVGTYNFLPLPRFYVQAKSGSAIIEDWQKRCRVAKLLAWQEKDVLPVVNAAGITKTMAPRDEVTIKSYELERPESNVHDFYRNILAVLTEGAEPLIKCSEVARVLKVMEAAFKSAEADSALDVSI